MSAPENTGAQHSNLALRIAATAVLAPLAIAAAYFGGWSWGVLVLAVAIGLYAEWLSVVGLAWRYAPLAAGVAAILVLAFAIVTAHFQLAALAVVIGAALIAALSPADRRLWSAAGLVYAAAAFAGAVLLRADLQTGFVAILFVFAMVWASDILGYVCGRGIGGPKLWPRVSPKKTWAGAVGGFAGCIAIAAGFALAGAGKVLPLILIGGLLSVTSQLGDLLESAVKRRFDVKDSSQIIPGHGGLMDRLDGFVAAVVVAALIGVWRVGPDAAGRGLLLW
jgi:phosphatidate cytidylyltransferase